MYTMHPISPHEGVTTQCFQRSSLCCISGNRQPMHQPILASACGVTAGRAASYSINCDGGSGCGGRLNGSTFRGGKVGSRPRSSCLQKCSSGQQAVDSSNSSCDVQCTARVETLAAHGCGRRALLNSLATTAGGAFSLPILGGPTAHAADASADALQRRIQAAPEFSRPNGSLFSRPGMIYFPRWCFGEWDVVSRFRSFETPLGPAFVEPSLMSAAQAPPEQGGVGSTTPFVLHYYSTLPDTFDNNLRVFTGSMPRDAIIQDRAYNTKAMTNAYLGFAAVESVQYDGRDSPGRETVIFARVSPSGGSLPPKKSELYINNTTSEDGEDADGRPTFTTSELYRQVILAVGDIAVTDYEVITRYTLLQPGMIAATQWSAVYLDPRQPRYFQAGNRAVAVYAYEWQMSRHPPPQDARGAIACVETPKDAIQCL